MRDYRANVYCCIIHSKQWRLASRFFRWSNMTWIEHSQWIQTAQKSIHHSMDNLYSTFVFQCFTLCNRQQSPNRSPVSALKNEFHRMGRLFRSENEKKRTNPNEWISHEWMKRRKLNNERKRCSLFGDGHNEGSNKRSEYVLEMYRFKPPETVLPWQLTCIFQVRIKKNKNNK